MKTKTLALAFFIFHLAILLFICVTWYNYNNSVFDYGETTGGFFAIALSIATFYYFGLTVWTYTIYKKTQQNQASVKLQLAIIFTLSILTTIFLFYKIYY